MKFLSKITMIILVVLLPACAKHLTKNEVESIQRVGITNHFPEYFTHMTADIALPGARGLRQIHDAELKKFVGAELRKQLQQRGFSIVEVKNCKLPYLTLCNQYM